MIGETALRVEFQRGRMHNQLVRGSSWPTPSMTLLIHPGRIGWAKDGGRHGIRRVKGRGGGRFENSTRFEGRQKEEKEVEEEEGR